MEYQKMPGVEGLLELGDLRKAKKCTAEKVRFVLQNRKLKSLPKEIEDTGHIPHVEFDISYNRTLDHEQAFSQLAGLSNLKGLGIIKNEIKVLPEAVAKLTALETLDLWSNGLKKLPENFSNLSRLQYLNLRNNSLSEFPESILSLKKLKSLNLRFNKIKKIPETLFDLTDLEFLDLSSCKLSTLPPAIKKLTKLKELVLESNDFKTLPEQIAELKNLTTIHLKGNESLDYEQAFEVISQLPNIKALSFKEWRISTLPSSVGLITSLEELDISYNPVTVLPQSFKALTNLRKFDYNGTCLTPETTFPIIAHWQKFTNLNFYSFKREQNEFFTLPESIGDLQFCENLHISYAKNIPGSISRLTNLKSLTIEESDIEALPDLSPLSNLEHVTIVSSPKLKALPDTFYHLPKLKSLTVGGTALDAAKLHHLKKLEELIMTDLDEKIIKTASQLPLLKKLSSRDEKLTRLPPSYFSIFSLTEFSFFNYPELDAEYTLSQLKQLPQLTHITFSHKNQAPLSWYIEQLKDFKTLKSVRLYVSGKEIPKEIESLRSIPSIQLEFAYEYNDKNLFDFPLEYSLFSSDAITILRHDAIVKKAQNSLQQIDWWNLTNETSRKTAFALLMGYYDKLGSILSYPFDDQGKIFGAKIFIAGKPTVGTIKSISDDLKSRGGSVVKKLDDQVTHVLLGPDVPEEIIPELFKHKFVFLLEDHLKKQMLSEDTPYLMTKEHGDLNLQITRLLKSRDEENLTLILEMVEGGGASGIILNYLLAVHLFHDDVEIRKKSRSLFKKYASADLQNHIKSQWKDSLREKDIDQFKKLLAHPSIDLGAFILAFKMVRWHQARLKGVDDLYSLNKLSTVRLDGYEGTRLTDSMKDWDFLTDLVLEEKKTIDEHFIYDKISHLPLKSISCTGVFKEFPSSWLAIPTLEHLTLRSYYELVEVSVPQVNVNMKLKELTIHNIGLRHAENLSSFRALKRIDLVRNGLSDVSFLGSFAELENLIVSENRVSQIPASFEKLIKLKTIYLGHNPLQKVSFNFSCLPELEEVNLTNTGLESLGDHFETCTKLRRVYLANNQLTSLPLSLLTIKSGSYFGVDIDASKNQIKTLQAPSPSMISKLFSKVPSPSEQVVLGNINLSDNLLEEVPEFFTGFSRIDRLQLTGNPIRKFPSSLDKLKISELMLEQTEIEEVPVAIFRSPMRRIVLSKKSGPIKLPATSEIPNKHEPYIAIYGNDQNRQEVTEFMKVVEMKRKHNEF